MTKQNDNMQACNHVYILDLGKNEEQNERYYYCLTCGHRVKRFNYSWFVTNATRYLTEMPIDTEENRQAKVKMLQQKYLDIAEEEDWTYKEEIIGKFKDFVEEKDREKRKRKIY